MKFIAHRGNLTGRQPARENSPDYIMQALAKGFDCEIDVWYVLNKNWESSNEPVWYLGHDEPTYVVTESFLTMDGLWCHAKSMHTFHMMRQQFKFGPQATANYFWHTNEPFAITSKGNLWTCEMPLYNNEFRNMIWMTTQPTIPSNKNDVRAEDICTDYAMEWDAQWYRR